MIRAATQLDISEIVRIYNHYVLNTAITFETEPVSIEDMMLRIENTKSDNLPWLIAQDDAGNVIGYAYATKWKGRCAYKYSVEITVYLDNSVTSKGWGTQLYKQLLAQLKIKGYHVAIGGISLPNPASIALHEKFGMKKVAHFEEVGHKFNKWVDVGYWQCVINKI